MRRNLQILTIATITIFSIGCSAIGSKSSAPIIRTKVLLCPNDPPPECEIWKLKIKGDFEFNTELESDWLKGQEIYYTCNALWRAYSNGWTSCKEELENLD